MKEDKNDSDNILRTNKLTSEEMEVHNNSAITQHNIGLFTEYARKEGLEEGFKKGLKKGYKKGLKERLEKRLKGKMDIDEMETFIETVLNTVERDFSAEDIADLIGISIEQEVNDLWGKIENMKYFINPKNEIFYMFYCATGNKGRTIGLLTSKPVK